MFEAVDHTNGFAILQSQLLKPYHPKKSTIPSVRGLVESPSYKKNVMLRLINITTFEVAEKRMITT